MQAGFTEEGKIFLIFVVETFPQNTLGVWSTLHFWDAGLIALKQIHLDWFKVLQKNSDPGKLVMVKQ